ncbi:MarR family winged helix-turn-helix transcriptional regulator [Chitinophaga barathri]|uniref:MarR family transcriptional regulator n=1 Tax=Chitinophaga barathri TaxID=1647451 RepID=A0A3N4M5F6_9BACT|nr:MarR family transcriptional regulator [Chitinophaga barathri]RPD38258.1 MarR family transcriptional regulator [Chitinophaga barathri]
MEQLKFDNQVCFPLYVLSRQVTAHYRPLLEKLDLTYPQYLVLLLLWEHKLQTVKDLGEKLCLDSGTLTPLLKRLEKKGLITRYRCKTDERIVEIVITPEGMNLRKKAQKIPMQLQASLNLDDKERETLHKQLQRLMDKIKPVQAPADEI